MNAGWARTHYGRDYFAEVVQPTWGVDDRPYAPFDGYLWEGENGEIEAYGGGQYLPYVNEIKRFDKMEYTATCTPAKNDNTHAFFKHPSKFKMLTE